MTPSTTHDHIAACTAANPKTQGEMTTSAPTISAPLRRGSWPKGREVIVAQRRAPPDLPEGATFAPADALGRDAGGKAVRGAGQFVVAIGFPYSGVLWREVWPEAIANFVAACKATGARMVFIDDLYMYGPQPLTDTGWKPAARSAATRVWMAAAGAGEARVAALRAPDFYGPGVGNSFLGDTSIGKLSQGKPAVFIGSPDVLHDCAYVPDVARAATTLLAAPDSVFGQAWHVPCAPTRTTRDVLKIAAETLGVKLRISAMPAWMLGASGMFSPFLRELQGMRFPWTGLIMWTPAGSPKLSGRTRPRSRLAFPRRRLRSGPP
jgi:nucleoside-diphosphate-sugar epimerase